MAKPSASFRAGVGVIVMNREGLVLGLERSDIPGAWQAPQGGIAPDEAPIEAAARELSEETNIQWSDVELLAEYPTWLGYELPAYAQSSKSGRGQVHRWFLVRFLGADEQIDVHDGADSAEFAAWDWMPFAELIHRTWAIRRPAYFQLAAHWSPHLAEN